MAEDVTQLLAALSEGHDSAVNKLLPVVYDELRRLADGFLRGERSDHTLQATALVHEAYLRLAGQNSTDWQNRAHFFAIASQAMRRILVDHARTHNREKRGGAQNRVPFDTAAALAVQPILGEVDLIALDDALVKLAQIQPQALRVVEMRCFGGLSSDDAAAVLGVSSRTVERQWRYARAWLYQELGGEASRAREGGNGDKPA